MIVYGDMIKEIVIILVVLLYWKLFYYNHRSPKTSQFYLLIPAVIACLAGIYSFFIGDAIPKNVYVISFIVLVYDALAFINIGLVLRKHKLNHKIDFTLTWIKKTLGIFFVYVAVIISFPALFFIVLGTYKLLGYEHIYLWVLVLIAWLVSGIKLFKNHVIK